MAALVFDPARIRYEMLRPGVTTMKVPAFCDNADDCWAQEFAEAAFLEQLLNHNLPVSYRNDAAVSYHLVRGKVVEAIYVRNHFLYLDRGLGLKPVFYRSVLLRKPQAL